MQKILVLGLGNYILMDEGVGVHVVHSLEKMTLPSNVSVLDGGTGGVYLIGEIQDFDHLILIDASLDDYPEGTVRVVRPKYSSDYPVKLSAHEFGLKDMIETMIILGTLPEITLVTISVKKFNEVRIGLTSTIESSVQKVIDTVLAIVGSAATMEARHEDLNV